MTYTKDNIVFQELPNKFGEDLTGKTFDRLTVLGFAFRDKSTGNGAQWHWWCECQCNEIVIVPKTRLVKGFTRSCGCFRQEMMADKQRTHGKSNTSIYKIWTKIKQRCFNSASVAYRYYGGRGITMCDRWQSFEMFANDMGERPSAKHSVERVDNDGNYCPENCIWALRPIQANNTRSNHRVTYQNRTQNVSQWAVELGCSAKTLYNRLHLGWSDEATISTPIKPRNW